jgi:outer membrane lipoprotein SlyB
MKRKRFFVLCLLMSVIVIFSACAGMTPTQKGAVGGAAVGAVAGQLIGGNTAGTLIGAGVGALGGALMNDAMDKKKKQEQPQ